jgi:PAS domain S-box-containing protein
MNAMPVLPSGLSRVLSRVICILDWRRFGIVLPVIVFALSLAVTYKFWSHERNRVLEKLQGDFEADVSAVISRIEERMFSYKQVLRGLHGFIEASQLVSRSSFSVYVGSLRLQNELHNIHGLGFAANIPAKDKAAHIAAMRRSGFPDYLIQPECETGICAPTVFIEPMEDYNQRSIGFNNLTDTARRLAMERARDEGHTAISGKLLLRETDGHVRAGFMMFKAVYRKGAPHDTIEARRASLVGWVYATFLMNDMMEGVLGSAKGDIDIEIHDGEGIGGETLVYDSDIEGESISDETLMYDSDISNSHLVKDSGALFRTTSHLDIEGRRWTLAAHSLPGFDSQMEDGKPQFIAYAGTAASALLTFLTWLLVYGRRRALQDAEEFARSEARYRQMFEENASIAYLLDPDTGRIVDANAAALAFWGYTREELRDMNISKISFAPSGKVAEVMEILRQGTTHRVEMFHKLKNGEIRDVEVFSGPLAVEGQVLRYSIAHDITTRKRAEEALRLSSTVFDIVDEAVVVTDADNNIVMVNPAFTAISGYSAPEALGKNPRILASGKHTPEFYQEMWKTLLRTGNWAGEIHDRHKNGEIYTKWLSIKLLRDESGKVSHYVAVFSAMSAHGANNRHAQGA